MPEQAAEGAQELLNHRAPSGRMPLYQKTWG